MLKKKNKSSKSSRQSFPEEAGWAAAGEDSMVQRRHNRHRGPDQEPNLVCHHHYDLAHSQEHESIERVSKTINFIPPSFIPLFLFFLLSET